MMVSTMFHSFHVQVWQKQSMLFALKYQCLRFLQGATFHRAKAPLGGALTCVMLFSLRAVRKWNVPLTLLKGDCELLKAHAVQGSSFHLHTIDRASDSSRFSSCESCIEPVSQPKYLMASHEARSSPGQKVWSSHCVEVTDSPRHHTSNTSSLTT